MTAVPLIMAALIAGLVLIVFGRAAGAAGAKHANEVRWQGGFWACAVFSLGMQFAGFGLIVMGLMVLVREASR